MFVQQAMMIAIKFGSCSRIGSCRCRLATRLVADDGGGYT
jgi:hypothetical protein